jgi:hypothetical protein
VGVVVKRGGGRDLTPGPQWGTPAPSGGPQPPGGAPAPRGGPSPQGGTRAPLLARRGESGARRARWRVSGGGGARRRNRRSAWKSGGGRRRLSHRPIFEEILAGEDAVAGGWLATRRVETGATTGGRGDWGRRRNGRSACHQAAGAGLIAEDWVRPRASAPARGGRGGLARRRNGGSASHLELRASRRGGGRGARRSGGHAALGLFSAAS